MTEEVPECDSGANTDVEGMFDAPLRDFKHYIRYVGDFLADAMHLVARHKQVSLAEERGELLERHTVERLLKHADAPAVGLHAQSLLERGVYMAPCHRLLGSKSRLGDFGMRGAARDAAENNLAYHKGVGSAEERADVMHRADIVGHDSHRKFRQFPVFRRGASGELDDGFLTVC